MAKDYNPEMHTAEHILNAVMTGRKGVRSFSNHIEKKKSKCDFRLESPLTEEEIILIEKNVNDVINSKLPVTAFEISVDEAEKKFNLERLPEGSGEMIRIVKIGEFDEYPCIGEHVENTGSIGRFRIVSSDCNNGIMRIRFRLDSPE